MNAIPDHLEREKFGKTVHCPLSPHGEFLTADWVMPPDPRGIIVFAHGSGSGRHSFRNQAVARYLEERGMGTFLLDLLTPEEEETDLVTKEHRFDIPLLSRRLADATCWLRTQPEAKHLPLAYFGASTGAAAALIAAARLPGKISSVVSRGGRPDLAGDILIRVTSPTLLLVGGRDDVVIELNKQAMEKMRAPRELVIIPGATHLFEEPGTLEEVARRAAEWFLEHFPRPMTSHENFTPVGADDRRCEQP
jgi:alpha-beta hydrolase superfamily lysophospholipase